MTASPFRMPIYRLPPWMDQDGRRQARQEVVRSVHMIVVCLVIVFYDAMLAGEKKAAPPSGRDDPKSKEERAD